MKLTAQGLKKRYKDKWVVKGLNLEVNGGEIVGLLGPNGAGKTTTFYLMAGFLRPDEGSIYLGEEEITPYEVSERAKRGIIYLPQETSVFRSLSVEDNLRMALEGNLRGEKKEELMEHYLLLFDLQDLLAEKAQNLSGGEKRRVEVVRALLTEPSYILLDEPFAGIDPIGIAQLKKLFQTLKKEGIGLLLSDHNVRETLQICDRAYVIADGVIIGSGESQGLLGNQEVRERYLGSDFRL